MPRKNLTPFGAFMACLTPMSLGDLRNAAVVLKQTILDREAAPAVPAAPAAIKPRRKPGPKPKATAPTASLPSTHLAISTPPRNAAIPLGEPARRPGRPRKPAIDPLPDQAGPVGD